MKLKDAITKITECDELKEWKLKNKESYLSTIFVMMDEKQKSEWQFGYYNPKNDKMTSFFVFEDSIKQAEESEVFKEPGAAVKELDLSKVTVWVDKALETANNLQEKKYPKETPEKVIVILQNIEEGTLWNITYVTRAFNTLNIKVDAATGKIISDKLTNLMQFRA
ncbi:MAG: hypothetical protein Q7J54_03655 [Candidatus Woesearchaeota archaeon]|nr:hypothetical protein [Candidatus Woesearchaeota archaeon]